MSASRTARRPSTRPAAVHFPALLRLDGYDPADPARLLPPAACLTAADLADATRWATRAVTYRSPAHPARPGGWLNAWGTEIDVRIIAMTGTGDVAETAMVGSSLTTLT